MDDLVLIGAAGIAGLVIAAVVILYGAYSIAGLVVGAYLSGEYGQVLAILGSVFVAGSVYMATGLWLHTTDRI